MLTGDSNGGVRMPRKRSKERGEGQAGMGFGAGGSSGTHAHMLLRPLAPLCWMRRVVQKPTGLGTPTCASRAGPAALARAGEMSMQAVSEERSDRGLVRSTPVTSSTTARSHINRIG